MTNTQERLAAIGFGGRRREPACWRTMRLDTPTPRHAEYGMEPGGSPILLNWCRLLRFDSRASPYRITRIER